MASKLVIKTVEVTLKYLDENYFRIYKKKNMAEALVSFTPAQVSFVSIIVKS